LHDKRGTHRNLKSQNVLFAPEDEVGTDRILVSDEVLGWACGARGWLPSEWPADAEESEVLATLLDNGGTPTHMAPEFWGTWPTTSPSFDVYAFGVLLYETLCRRLPFVDPGSLPALRRAHKEAPVPDPRRWNSEIPPVLGNLMQACMAKDPRERPGGVGPLAEQLGELYREVTGQDYRVARQRPATPELDLELRKHRAGQMVVRGISARHGGDFDAACSLLEEAAAMLRELDDPAALQHCLNRHAQVLCECGRLDEAWALLEEQQSLCHQLGDGGALSMCLGLRAAVLKEQGELEAALAVLAEQDATCRGLEDLGNLSSCLFNQGGILAKLDHREEALQKIEESENLSRQLEDFEALRQSLHYHALLLQAWDRPKEALPILKEEEAVCRQLGDPDALSACREAQASVLDDLDRG
jgi:tetratricopeptide (TPR) repeat protein